MQNERDDFDKLLYHTLYNLELAPPAKGWERLERELIPKRRQLPIWRSVAAVAAIGLLVVALSVKLSVDTEAEPEALIANVDSVVEDSAVEESVVAANPVATTAETPHYAAAVQPAKRSSRTLPAASVATFAVRDEAVAVVAEATANPVGQSGTTEQRAEATVKPTEQSADVFDLDAYARQLDNQSVLEFASATKKESNWNLGLYAANQGSIQTGGVGGGIRPFKGVVMDIDNRLVSQSVVKQVSLKHDIPLSGGVTVRKHFSKRFAVETGLVYTYLHSSGEKEGDYGYELDQYLHYLGIPATAIYTFYSAGGFDIYGAAGGMVEKCVSAVRTMRFADAEQSLSTKPENLTINSLDVSATIKLGASYDLSRHVGLSFEPSVNYYVTSTNKVETYRSTNPLGFSLRLGVYAKF